MIKFDWTNPLEGLEELDHLSGVGPLGTHIDNHKNVAANNVDANTRTFDTTKPCDQSGHSFDDCPALKSITHLQKHCIKWKTFLANKGQREAGLPQQTEIDPLEAEHTEVKHNKDCCTEETADFSDAATKPIGHISDFTMGEPQMPTV